MRRLLHVKRSKPNSLNHQKDGLSLLAPNLRKKWSPPLGHFPEVRQLHIPVFILFRMNFTNISANVKITVSRTLIKSCFVALGAFAFGLKALALSWHFQLLILRRYP